MQDLITIGVGFASLLVYMLLATQLFKYSVSNDDWRQRVFLPAFFFLTLAMAFVIGSMVVMREALADLNNSSSQLSELHQLENVQFTKAAFHRAGELIPKLEGVADQPDHPLWEKTRREVEDVLWPGKRFGHTAWDFFVAWGATLPGGSTSDERAALAALKRLTGNDDLKARVGKHDIPFVYLLMLNIFYPNEDVAILHFGDIVGHRAPENSPDGNGSLAHFVWHAGRLVLFGLVIQMWLRSIAVSGLGFVLGLRDNPRYRRFEKEVFGPERYAVTFFVFLALALPTNAMFIDPYAALIHPSYLSFLQASLWNLMICGVLVESIEQVAGVLLIRLGYDPLETVWDNLAAGAVAVGLLLAVKNSWPSILLGLGFGMAQSLCGKVAHWRRVRAPVAQ